MNVRSAIFSIIFAIIVTLAYNLQFDTTQQK